MKIIKLLLILFLSSLAYGKKHHIHFSDDDKWGEMTGMIKKAFHDGSYDITLKNNEKEISVSPNGYDWKILSIQGETKTSIDCIRVVRFRETDDRYILCSVNLSRMSQNAQSYFENNLHSPFFFGCKGVVLIVYAPSEMRMRDIYAAYKKCEKSIEPYTVSGVLITETKP
jgi:hypothetical protein